MVRAYIMIKIEGSEYSGAEKTIKEKIAKMPEVIKVDSIFGRFDIVAQVEAKEPRELSLLVTEKIESIPSVVSTEAFICHEV